VEDMGKVMSEETKYKLAYDLGFGEKVEDNDW
jgi:small acid-soluble spore protein F (minor alpha/beta-type SASP)